MGSLRLPFALAFSATRAASGARRARHGYWLAAERYYAREVGNVEFSPGVLGNNPCAVQARPAMIAATITSGPCTANVRFGSLADTRAPTWDVCFTPKSGQAKRRNCQRDDKG